MSKEIHDKILELEDATWKALSDSGAKLIPYLSRDCQMLFPMGLKVTATSDPNLKDIMTSDAFIPWSGYKMHDVVVMELGEDVAAITYKVKAMRPAIDAPDDGAPFKALISSVWRKDTEGDYLMVLHQQTPYDMNMEEQ